MPSSRDVDPVLAGAIADELLSGRLTPVLGAGVNLAGRPQKVGAWTPGCGWYPSGVELARYLAEASAFVGDDDRDLMEVATWIGLTQGSMPLYRMLRAIFDIHAPPTMLHRLLARACTPTRAQSADADAPLIVTTNYDDAMERALDEAGQSFDVVTYVADGSDRGRFRHVGPTGEAVMIDGPHDARFARLGKRPAILKLHGTIDRSDERGDSYVITEQQYVEYLTYEAWHMVPVALHSRLRHSHLLFLGYGLRDWNLLVILNRLGALPPQMTSWAIQLRPGDIDHRRWGHYTIESFDMDIVEFVGVLDAALQSGP